MSTHLGDGAPVVPAAPPAAPGNVAYVPSHAVPGDGLPAWDVPDGQQTPGATLDPGLDVQVLDQQGDWAHIACSNGWQAWVDARRLVPLGSSQVLPQPQSTADLTPAPSTATPTWVPSHVAPRDGMTTWLSASPAAPVGERLDPGLPVEVLERQESWARIACSNGWQAWSIGVCSSRTAAAP